MMDRRALIWIIALASVALLGLVTIQVYWIRNGLKIREANFRMAVDHVVHQVIYQLEWQDVGLLLEENGQLGLHHDQVLEKMDSLRGSLDDYLRSLPSKKFKKGKPAEEYSIEMKRATEGIVINPNAVQGSEGTNRQSGNPGFLDEISQKGDSGITLSKRKQLLMEKMLDDVIRKGTMPEIDARLTAADIDTLLRESLSLRGIELDYVFGVYSPSRHGFVIEKAGANLDLLLQKGMVFPLFPSESRAVPDYLLIWFPGEREALLRQLWAMTGTSVILLLVIMGAFAYSITIVLKQKKFAEMKNDFINNMTHEFKTPISTVALACEALTDIEISKSAALYDEYINIISEENKRLGIMAEKILQTAIIEKGQVRLKKEMIDIHKVIEDVIRNIRIQVEIKDGTISTLFMAAKRMVNADPVHIANVVYNLLDNANKYTPRKPDIRISTENIGDGIMIRVADNGIGIAKVHQRKVFDKLYRVPTGDVHDFKGFGLGLSYVKAIVEQHGGHVTLESELNKGSEFGFYLPQRENE